MSDNNVFNLLADVLEYPSEAMTGKVREAAALLASINPSARRSFDEFSSYCTATGLSRLQEVYTETFDLEPACPPYVGYHLFGEDRVRGMFMVRLKEHYGTGIDCGNELPDHITHILRALSLPGKDEETRELKEYCLIPALKKMQGLLEKENNAYRGVFRALLLLLHPE